MIPRPQNPKIGMMKKMVNGRHHRLITQSVMQLLDVVNGGGLIREIQRTRENGMLPSLRTLTTRVFGSQGIFPTLNILS